MVSQFDTKGTFGSSDTYIERIGDSICFKDASNASAATLSELRLQRRTDTYNLAISKEATFFKSPFPALISRAGTSYTGTAMSSFAFDASTEEFVVYDIYVPLDLNPSGTVNVRFQWLPASASSNNVVWKIYYAPIDAGESFDVSMSSKTITSAGNASTNVISEAVITDTVFGFGWSPGDHLIFHVSRDATNGSDTLSVDAQLVGLAIEFPLKNSGSQGNGGDFQVKGINTGDSSSIESASSETNFSLSTQLAANSLSVGNMIEVTAAGKLSTKTGSTQGIWLRVKYGTINLAEFYVEIPAGLTNKGWYLKTNTTIRTAGDSGTATTNGFIIARQGTITTTDDIQAYTKPGTQTPIDTTTATDIYVSADWDTSDASNSVTLETLDIAQKQQSINPTGGFALWSGDISNTTQHYLSNSLTLQPVLVKDNDGFAVQNASDIEGVRIKSLNITTTNATQTEMVVDTGIYLDTVVTGETWLYTINIVARGYSGTNSGESAAYKLEFVVENTGGTTDISGVVQTVIREDVNDWNCTAIADDTNDRPTIKVTGDSGTVIHWKAYSMATNVS